MAKVASIILNKSIQNGTNHFTLTHMVVTYCLVKDNRRVYIYDIRILYLVNKPTTFVAGKLQNNSNFAVIECIEGN